MYYKLSRNNVVVDVIERRGFVRWQAKHGMLVPCAEDCANGVVGTDGKVYHVDTMPEIPLETVETVQEIGRAEYLALADSLGKTVEPLIADVPILREQLREQTERNDFLEECLLEMSKEVYK